MGNGFKRTEAASLAGTLWSVAQPTRPGPRTPLTSPANVRFQENFNLMYFALFSPDYACPSPPETLAANNSLVLINNSLPIEELVFTNCSASFNQKGYPCENAMQEEGVGWAYYALLPAAITLQLENSTSEISQIDLIIAEGFPGHWPDRFMFELLKDGNWMWPNWVDIVEPDDGYYDQATGEFQAESLYFKFVIKFDPITDVSQVRLNIYNSPDGNAVIKQIKAYGTFPDPGPGYHLQIPTLVG